MFLNTIKNLIYKKQARWFDRDYHLLVLKYLYKMSQTNLKMKSIFFCPNKFIIYLNKSTVTKTNGLRQIYLKI